MMGSAGVMTAVSRIRNFVVVLDDVARAMCSAVVMSVMMVFVRGRRISLDLFDGRLFGMIALGSEEASDLFGFPIADCRIWADHCNCSVVQKTCGEWVVCIWRQWREVVHFV